MQLSSIFIVMVRDPNQPHHNSGSGTKLWNKHAPATEHR